MLNGIAPLIIFIFKPADIASIASYFSGIPKIESAIKDFGIPIPIYLDFSITGILVESETRGLDLQTDPEGEKAENKVKVSQRPLDNIVTVNMLAKRDSIMLSVLLALSDQVFTRAVSETYSLNYFNNLTTIFDGRFHNFTTGVSSDDNLIRMSLSISKAAIKTTSYDPKASQLPNVRGTKPVFV